MYFRVYKGFFDTGKRLKNGESVYSVFPYFVVEKDFSRLVEPTEEELEEIDELMKRLS